ncbi:MAG: hypothetical protein DRP63_05920 [Planctomycetota bacterium]|nr:MAG: hypothetical protein DRP63_05920 [Planctomycetota bacterium]
MSRVSVSVFNGPLDLLLLLARRLEVDALEVDVSRVAEQVAEGVDDDLSEAGRSLRQTAALINLKTGLLYRGPKTTLPDFVDPAAEMTCALEEFRLMQERTLIIGRLMEKAAKRHCRGADRHQEFDLDELGMFDLAAQYAHFLKETQTADIDVQGEQRSVEEFLADLLPRVEGRVVLQSLLEGRPQTEWVGYFLATLEGCLQGLIRALQSEPYKPIFLERCRERECAA